MATRATAFVFGVAAVNQASSSAQALAKKVGTQFKAVKLYNWVSEKTTIKGWSIGKLSAESAGWDKISSGALKGFGMAALYATGSLVALVAARYIAGPASVSFSLPNSISIPFTGCALKI